MKILVGCEESQAVTIELRKLGHQAYSCDILNCSGGFPQWHIKDDVRNLFSESWDMGIFFPPCTHIALSGNMHFEKKIKDGRQKKAIDFFLDIANAPIHRIAIENPRNIMTKHFRKYDQIIHPYYFGDPYQKETWLWLKNLPLLYHNKEPNLFDSKVTHVEKGDFFKWKDKKGKIRKHPLWYYEARKGDHSKNRSKTFAGIAKAMAKQWT